MGQQSSQSYTVTFSNRKTVSRDHNLRNPNIVKYEKHIDPNGEHETWIDENPRDAFKRIFEKSVKEYNDKQKRADRKIDDYYSKIKNSKDKNPVYEVYVTVGNKDHHPDPEVAKEILKDFLNDWKNRNPNLEVIGAYYHADEPGAPHLHIDYIPIKENKNPKRGMRLEVGADAAFKALGFKHVNSHETPQIQWQHRERLSLEKICLERGFGVIHPERDSKIHYEKEQFISFQEHQKQITEILKLQSRQREIEPIEILEEKKKLFGEPEPKKAVFVYDDIMDVLERLPKIETIKQIALMLDDAADRVCEINRTYNYIDRIWLQLDNSLDFYKKECERLQKENLMLAKRNEDLAVKSKLFDRLKEQHPEIFLKSEKNERCSENIYPAHVFSPNKEKELER